MFKKREFVVKMRKAEPDSDTKGSHEEVISLDDETVDVLNSVKMAVYHAAIGVCAYVLLDTYRQIKVARHTDTCEHHRL